MQAAFWSLFLGLSDPIFPLVESVDMVAFRNVQIDHVALIAAFHDVDQTQIQ